MIPSELFSVSGNEETLTQYLKSRVGGECDNLGNLIVTKEGQGKKIAVCCPIDEKGIFVTDVSSEKIRFATIGRCELSDMINRTVEFKNGVRGFICCENALDKAKESDLYIRADGDLSIGDIARFTSGELRSKETVVSHAVPRDFCIEAVIKIMDDMKNTDFNMMYIFSSMYGIGKKGMNAAFMAEKPDFAIVIDSICDNEKNIKCGCGPVIKITEGSYTAPSCLHEFAKEQGVAMAALKESDVRGENSFAFGVVSGYVSIPVKKLSGGLFEGNISDIDKTAGFVKDFVAKDM